MTISLAYTSDRNDDGFHADAAIYRCRSDAAEVFALEQGTDRVLVFTHPNMDWAAAAKLAVHITAVAGEREDHLPRLSRKTWRVAHLTELRLGPGEMWRVSERLRYARMHMGNALAWRSKPAREKPGKYGEAV
jgi:hypothetical protein